MLIQLASYIYSKLFCYIQDAPSLISSLTESNGYHIKWTRLADLPVAMYGAYAAVQNRKIYVTGGNSPSKDFLHYVFVYEIDNDRWYKLPPAGQYCAVPHIIGDRLVLIGGCLLATTKRTNKVSTFDQTNQTWVSYYPDLLSVRNKPGVVTHMEHVIVAGGTKDDGFPVDDIEILNWIENSHWKRLSIHLPEPMCSFTPTISDDHLFIVGYTDAKMCLNNHVYGIPVVFVTKKSKSTKWIKLVRTTHWRSNLVNGSSPLVVVGGHSKFGITTADISMYDKTQKNPWMQIDALPFARSSMTVAVINDNAIIVIGGCTNEESVSNAMSTCLTTVELGQVEQF